MFVVDSNILLYAAETSFTEHRAAYALLDRWRHESAPWCLTWGIAYEFMRVSTHSRVFPAPWTAKQAWVFVRSLLASRSLHMLVETARHEEVVTGFLAQVQSLRGSILHDVHTAALMIEHGIRRVYTHDTDFHRFPGIEVIDPFRSV